MQNLSYKSSLGISLLLFSLVFISVFISVFSTVAQAHNLFVTPSGVSLTCNVDDPCAKVQTAIDAAGAGDHIFIGPGTYTENLTVPAEKENLRITGTGKHQVIIVSAGGLPEKVTASGVEMDIVMDIFAPGVTVEKLSLIHPGGAPTKRDIGVFIHPDADGVVIQKTHIERQRSGDYLELPGAPGSRGILVFRATGAHLVKNEVGGNYQDHIHLPTSQAVVAKNFVTDATRLGIVVIKEDANSDNSNNHIAKNLVIGSGSDGIQIQGNHNFVSKNEISDSGGAAILLCGLNSGCVDPGSDAIAINNTVDSNRLKNNAADIVDDGKNNAVTP